MRALWSLAAAAAVTLAAQPAPPSPPQFRTGIDLVEVDVSVLDAKRRPVRGLAAADFTVSEDGTPREIVSFAAVDVPSATAASSGWTREVAPDVRSNLASAERLLVLVLDDAQVRWTPWHTGSVKATAAAVVDRLGPADLLAIVFTRDNRAAQPFTNDRSRLLAAIDKFSGDLGSGDPDYFYMGSLKTLRYVVQSLADAGQRRKVVLYLSPGVPLEGPGSEAADRRLEAGRIFEDARRANVNIYSVDPSGVGGLDGEDTVEKLGRTQAAANDFLLAAAANTGGRAIVNRNDGVTGIDEVFAENASYYLLGYRSSNTGPGNRVRRIDVRVNRPGVIVRARDGYIPGRVEATATTDAALAALSKTMREAAPRGDVGMQITAAPFAGPGGNTAAVPIALAFRQPRRGTTTRLIEQVDVIIGAYQPDGTRGPSERLNARVALRAGDDAFVRYEVLTAMQLKPGRYQLRVASQSTQQGQAGSLHYDLTVPDFSKGDIALSGVVLSAVPNVAAAGRERIATIVPVVPTSRRQFWAGDRVTAFLRVYRNKDPRAPIEVRTTILDASDATVFSARETFGADRFATKKSADYEILVPMATLAEGEYLLRIDATAGKTVLRRDVRFLRH